MKPRGVYIIRCKAANKCYVGQAMGAGGVKARLQQHRRSLLTGRHRNVYLQRAWNVYGATQFTMRCIRLCTSQAEADALEIRSIAHNKSNDPRHGYNLAPGGKRGGSMQHPVTYAKFCAAISRPEVRARISAANKGRKLTKEQYTLRWSKRKRHEASVRMRKHWRNPEFIAAHKASCNTESFKRRTSELRKREWQSRLNTQTYGIH